MCVCVYGQVLRSGAILELGCDTNMQQLSLHILPINCGKFIIYDEISVSGCVAICVYKDKIKRSILRKIQHLSDKKKLCVSS